MYLYLIFAEYFWWLNNDFFSLLRLAFLESVQEKNTYVWYFVKSLILSDSCVYSSFGCKGRRRDAQEFSEKDEKSFSVEYTL